MTGIQTRGGFTGDPAAALDVAGTSGCCGNPPTTTLTLPDPDQSAVAGASPCCGTIAEATEAGACCGTSAKAEAVASGTGCCG
ncbi:hypothetical protein AB0H83_25170 [Dactylosporangium sp. NPDC050688]|uniref:hypothetical protein n=1 Tax=Dactylosporangium sp. NPDC050688 TaxID=3157217 RepID=UPI0033CB3938